MLMQSCTSLSRRCKWTPQGAIALLLHLLHSARHCGFVSAAQCTCIALLMRGCPTCRTALKALFDAVAMPSPITFLPAMVGTLEPPMHCCDDLKENKMLFSKVQVSVIVVCAPVVQRTTCNDMGGYFAELRGGQGKLDTRQLQLGRVRFPFCRAATFHDNSAPV